MREERIIALFKLGEKKYMEELLHEGHVFMNTLSYFAKIEDDSTRADPDEGTSYCLDGEGARFRRKKGMSGKRLVLYPEQLNSEVTLWLPLTYTVYMLVLIGLWTRIKIGPVRFW